MNFLPQTLLEIQVHLHHPQDLILMILGPMVVLLDSDEPQEDPQLKLLKQPQLLRKPMGIVIMEATHMEVKAARKQLLGQPLPKDRVIMELMHIEVKVAHQR